MPSSAELEAKIKSIADWDGLRGLWAEINAGTIDDWEAGKALEYLVIRAFELDPDEKPIVRYPYVVPLFGENVEEIDGAVHLPGLSCLVESKDWSKKIPIEPIVKMRSQLLRRPAGTIGIVFSKQGFTDPARYLAHFAAPQAVLLWSGAELDWAFKEGRMCSFLRLKHRACCEHAIPDYNLCEANIQ